MTNGQFDPTELRFDLREGAHFAMELPGPFKPWAPLALAWSCSVMLGGKIVLLTGWPGTANLTIRSRLALHPSLMGFIEAAWPRANEHVQAWLNSKASRTLYPSPLPLPYCTAALARTPISMPAASVQIDWRPRPGP